MGTPKAKLKSRSGSAPAALRCPQEISVNAIFVRRLEMRSVLHALAVVVFVGSCFAQNNSADQWKRVSDQLGRTGSVQPGDVYKVGLPRTDLHVTVVGVEIKPALALGG